MAILRDFKGIPYPITKNPKGFFYIENNVDLIKADLLILLLTNPRERVMLPEYGTPLRRLFFDPSDPIIVRKAKDMIALSLQTWEPRVAIENIYIQAKLDSSSANELEEDKNNQQVLLIRITFFDRMEITKINELKLEIPLGA
jgi:phage baseplate assembly protein W